MSLTELDGLSDELLMQALQNGNADAFTTLYNRYHSALLNYVRGQIPRDRDLAEEVVQDAFMRVNNHKDAFNPDQLFRPWLYTLTDRLAINAKRNATRRTLKVSPETNFRSKGSVHSVRKELDREDIVLGICEAPWSVLEDHEAEAAKRQELLDLLPKYVQELPPDLRRIVQLVLTSGVSWRQAAKIVGMKRTPFRERMEKAIAIIHRRIELGDEPNNDCTLADIHDGTVRNLVDAQPADDSDALDRAVFQQSNAEGDRLVLSSILRKLLGRTATEPALV